MHAITIPEWASARALRFQRIDPGSTALLVIDLQNAFAADGCFPIPMAETILPNVNRMIDGFRAAGSLIVFIRHTYTEDPAWAPLDERRPDNFPRDQEAQLRSGGRQHALHDDLHYADGDLVIDKHRLSAMLPSSSGLHTTLRDQGIETVVICGAATNACCESTARDAAMMDYRVFFASDATATLHDDLHNAALLNLSVAFADVRPFEDILTLVDASVSAATTA